MAESHFQKHCPVCSEPTRHAGLYEKNGFLVGRCSGCGLGATRLEEGFDPTSIYTAEYFEGGAHDGYADYPASEAVLRRGFRETLDELERAGAGSGRLLEIGCAYGFFLLEARERYDVCGVEVAEEAAASCRERGLDVHHGPLTEAYLAERDPFDVVVLLDVIEHLEDPAETIRLAAHRLRSGGRLLLTTGDWGSLSARLLGKSWRLMTPPQHLYYFTEPTLRRLLSDHGLEVETYRHPWKTVPLDLILYQLLRMLRLPNRSFATLGRLGLPVNLFDACQLVARKR